MLKTIATSLKRKYGPLPLWAWASIVGGSLALWWWWTHRGDVPADVAQADDYYGGTAPVYGEPNYGDTSPIGGVPAVPEPVAPPTDIGDLRDLITEGFAGLEDALNQPAPEDPFPGELPPEPTPTDEPVTVVDPETAAVAGAGGVKWGGRTFYTKAGLAAWLEAHGATYATWAKRHPAAAATLEGPVPKPPAKPKPKAATKPSGRGKGRKPPKVGKGRAGARPRPKRPKAHKPPRARPRPRVTRKPRPVKRAAPRRRRKVIARKAPRRKTKRKIGGR